MWIIPHEVGCFQFLSHTPGSKTTCQNVITSQRLDRSFRVMAHWKERKKLMGMLCSDFRFRSWKKKYGEKTRFFGKLTLAAPTSKSSSLAGTWPIFFSDGLFERARPEQHAGEEIFPLRYLEEKYDGFFD